MVARLDVLRACQYCGGLEPLEYKYEYAKEEGAEEVNYVRGCFNKPYPSINSYANFYTPRIETAQVLVGETTNIPFSIKLQT